MSLLEMANCLVCIQIKPKKKPVDYLKNEWFAELLLQGTVHMELTTDMDSFIYTCTVLYRNNCDQIAIVYFQTF